MNDPRDNLDDYDPDPYDEEYGWQERQRGMISDFLDDGVDEYTEADEVEDAK